jgi:hypothetical protein
MIGMEGNYGMSSHEYLVWRYRSMGE